MTLLAPEEDDLPIRPSDKTRLFKSALHAARAILLDIQMHLGPMDDRYDKLNELIEPMEDLIVKA